MKIIDNDSHYQLVESAHMRVQLQPVAQITALNNAFLWKEMHLKIVEETEWHAVGEVCDPSCPHNDDSLFWALN